MPQTTKDGRIRGSVWYNTKKIAGYGRAVGDNRTVKGKKVFCLKPIRGGATKTYTSPQAAKSDGWVKEQ